MTIKEFQGKNRIYSNFYICNVKVYGIVYKSAEHAFQAMKATNEEDRIYIQEAPTPGKAKWRGNEIKVRSGWKGIRVGVMRHIVTCKFEQNWYLMDKLISTGNEILEEGNNWKDDFWGIYKGKGENWLGRILMEVREYNKGII